MEFQFVHKLKWTANGDLYICQCIWLLTKDKVSQAPSAEQKRAKPNKLCAGKWCRATSVCVGCVWGDCVGVWEEEMGARTRKGRKSEEANTCCFSWETPATLYLHPLFSLTSSSYPAVKYLNTSLLQHKADQHGALSYLHTPGTKCCHLLDIPFLSHPLYLHPLQSWACASTGHKHIFSRVKGPFAVPQDHTEMLAWTLAVWNASITSATSMLSISQRKHPFCIHAFYQFI